MSEVCWNRTQEVNQALEQHYRLRDEDSRLLSISGQVEFITTMAYIHKYFSPGSRLLEVGAGTGRYSIALTNEGYQITAVELLDCNIQKFRQKLSPHDEIRLLQGNALDLSAFEDGSFDGALLLGPLYHLYTREDKVRALQEAKRVVKPGGIILAAYIGNESVVLIDLFDNNGDALQKKAQNGRIREDWKLLTQPPMEFNDKSRLEEIDELNRMVNLTRKTIVSADGLTELIRDSAALWSEDIFLKYLDWHLTICERRDCIGFANHILDILQKDEGI